MSEMVELGGKQGGLGYDATALPLNWVEVPHAWLRAAGWVPASERDEARAMLVELDRESLIVCSSFNHHRPHCAGCDDVARAKALVASFGGERHS